MLGAEEGGGLFRRAQLKALVDLHGTGGGHGGELTVDETTIISGALDMSHKKVESAMTPLFRVQGVATDTPLTWPALREILACGHSRLPVHLPGDATAIVGLLLVKELFAAVTLEDLLPQAAPGKPPAAPRTIVDAIRLRPIPRMNAQTPLYTALNYFQTGRSHMAVVTGGLTVLYLDHATTPTSAPRLARQRSGGSVGAFAASPEASPLLPKAHTPPPPPPPPPPPGGARRSLDARAGAALIIDAQAAALSLTPAVGVIGLITLEDVLEELLQEEILDETDRLEGDESQAAADNDLTLQTQLSPLHPPPPPPPSRSPSPPASPPRGRGDGSRRGSQSEGYALLELHAVRSEP